MSEQQPLLAGNSNDLETANDSEQGHPHREWVGNFLESKNLHLFVLTLIAIDASCVLIDLGYTFLTESCASPGSDTPSWLEVLSHISLAINIFFMVEIPMALWAFGPQYYNPFGKIPHSTLHLFDATIIFTTFILEVALKGRERELAGLLVVLRLWRLVKLVGGVAVGAGELEDETVRQLAEAKEKLRQALLALSTARAEISELKKKAGLNNSAEDAPQAS